MREAKSLPLWNLPSRGRDNDQVGKEIHMVSDTLMYPKTECVWSSIWRSAWHVVQAPYTFAMVMLTMPPLPWGTDLPAPVADAGAAHCTRGRLSTRRRKRVRRRQQPCQDWIWGKKVWLKEDKVFSPLCLAGRAKQSIGLADQWRVLWIWQHRAF